MLIFRNQQISRLPNLAIAKSRNCQISLSRSLKIKEFHYLHFSQIANLAIPGILILSWPILQQPSLHRRTSNEWKRSPSTAKKSWRSRSWGKIHVTSSTWIKPQSLTPSTWKTIHVHTSTNHTKQVMLAVTVIASRKILPLMFIFEGEQNWQIVNHKFIMHPDVGHYTCQKRMDGQGHDEWVDWACPHCVKELEGVRCHSHLILDAYHVHMMGMIANPIQTPWDRSNPYSHGLPIFVSGH